MRSWEFLLQKEGDRTWLPLDNSLVEILEGRYRVVARTPCAQEEVDIYVSFISSEDSPPKRRIQQRSHAANDDGLLAILPFTPFRPGRWELRCRPHVEASDPAQQWPGQIQLQVLPQEISSDGDLFGWGQPEDDGADSQITTTDTGVAESTEAAGLQSEALTADVSDDHLAEASSPSAAELDPATASEADIQRLAAEMTQMVSESAAEPTSSVTGAAPAILPPYASVPVVPLAAPQERLSESSAGVHRSLEEEIEPALQATEAAAPAGATTSGGEPAANGEVMTEGDGLAIALAEAVVVMDGDRQVEVQGRITRPAVSQAAEADPAEALLPPDLLLTIELRDPSTTEIWASHRESFRQAMAPVSFTAQLQVPVACRTQLLLGNATLWQVEPDGSLSRLLAQDFNAMATVDSLLDQARQSTSAVPSNLPAGAVDSLQQQAASNFLVAKFGAQPQIAKGNVQINTELLNLLKPMDPDAAAGQSRSPRPAVHPVAVVAQPSNRPRLELPNFGNASRVSLPSANRLADDLAQQTLGGPLKGDGAGASVLDAFPRETFDAEAVPLAEGATSEPLAEAGFPLDEENPFLLSLDDEPDNGDPETQNPGEISLSDELGQAAALEPEQSERLDSAAPSSELAITVESVSSELAPADASELAAQSSGSTGLVHEVVVDDDETITQGKLAWMQPSPDPGLVDANIAVPTPELTVPEGALVKGETVQIQVRVAQAPARLCARLWLLDCQSRTLLGEPQWITAFLPLGDRWLEANVELPIPEGSIELQVEAIAVEPVTQRESRKVSTRRKVKLDGAELDLEGW